MNVFSTFPVFIEPPKTAYRAGAELKAMGMSQGTIETLASLDAESRVKFKELSGDSEATDRYIEEFRAKTDDVVCSMSPEDREIYQNYLKKYDLDK